MIYNLLDLFLDPFFFRSLQLIPEAILLHGKTEFSLPGGDVPIHVLIGEVPVQAQESVESLEEENVVPRETVVLDEFAVDELADTPSLETLNVAEPYRMSNAGFSEVVVEDAEEMAEAESDGFEVADRF